jgi:hypothetical protein
MSRQGYLGSPGCRLPAAGSPESARRNARPLPLGRSPRNDLRHEVQDSNRPHAVASRIMLGFGQNFHKRQDGHAEAAACPWVQGLLPATQRECAENLARCELPRAYRVRTFAC